MTRALLGPEFPLPLDHPFTYRQARDVGISRRALRVLVENGKLRQPLYGVYAAAQAPDTQLLRAQAIQLVAPDGHIVTDESAGWLAGAQMILSPGAHLEAPPLTVFATGDHHRLRNGLVDSGTRALLPRDITTVHGVLTTTPLRTALDLGRLRHRDRAIAALDQLLRLGVFSPQELAAELPRFKGMRGVRQLRFLVPRADARSESPPESALRLRVEDAGLGRAEPQQDIFDTHGRFLGRVDLLLEELGLVAEYFGEEFHGETEDDDDNARLEAIADEGYTIRVFRKHNLYGPHQDAVEMLLDGATEARRRLSHHRWV